MSKNLLEVREYNFKDGTTLTIELDRRSKTMSFVQYDGSQRRYKPQEFIFTGRQASYMNGWLNILNAMQYVIKDCKETMESWDEEETEKLIALLMPDEERQNV